MKIDFRKVLINFVAVILLVKICAIFIYQGKITVWEDDVIARNMLETGEMFYMQRGTANYMFQFPVYPSLLFFIYKMFGYNHLYAILLNMVVICLSCFFLFEIFINVSKILKLKMGKIICEFNGFLSVLIFLMHPFISYYSMFNVHPFVFDMFFPIAIIFLSFRFLQSENWKNLGLLAFTTGLGVLNRSTSFVALIPFIILAIGSMGFRRTILSLVTVFFVVGLVISPWLIRGYNIYGKVSMAPMLNEVLWKGSLYNSDGSNYLLDGRVYKSELSHEENNFLQGKPITIQNDFFKDKYVQLIREDPQHILKMYLVKVKNFWLYHQNIGIEYGKKVQSLLTIYKSYVFFLLLLNLCALYQFNYKPLVLLSYPICLSLIQSLFYIETRHRMIAEPIIIFIGILAVVNFISKSVSVHK
tara:strand:+ start:259 stop:1503 length:1245 start_codon:yes stop_codon:yes gene_type:complete